MAPFDGFHFFIGFDCFFKFSKHSGADRIDRCAKCVGSLPCVELKYIDKIFMLEVVVRISGKTAVHRIGYTVCHCGLKSYFDVIFIILLQEAVRNDVEDWLFIICPIFRSLLHCDIFKLIFQYSFCRNLKNTLHRLHNIRTVLAGHLPCAQCRRRTAHTGI